MDTRDSGVIDLFAIHKEEERRISEAPPASTGALPPVSFDTHVTPGGDADIDALAFAQQKSRQRAKIIGGVIGGLAVIGILVAAIASGGKEEPAKDATAAAPPAATETIPAAAPEPPPVAEAPKPAATPEPAPPSTAKSDGAYSRKDAVAAYKKSQGKGSRKTKPIGTGIKLQKIQSSGTN
ncbi:MAG: hypothetical protein KIT84_32490 [Labilithrix sp.]|nr:hypothetical protein [Labilithrix sp.]MCW5815793.1 hypothetical protein [Labilithrix sp.]